MTLLLLSELGTIVIFARVQIEQLVFMQGEVITINREDFFRRQVLGIIEHPFNSKKKREGGCVGDFTNLSPKV